MIFGIQVELFWAACIINFFLLFIWTMGVFMVNESRNEWDDDSAVIIFFGCIFVMVASGLQSFALAYWLSSFIK